MRILPLADRPFNRGRRNARPGADVADGLGPAGANVHFDERLEGDRLAFDDTLRPGVVRQRNALALMRAVGIDV